MTTNKYKPHIWVLPEDDANRQIANGFVLDPNVDPNCIQVLPPCGGWIKVLESLREDHTRDLLLYPLRMLVLVIDFDGDADRLDAVKSQIPPEVLDRVFIIGAQDEPEKLKRMIPRCHSYESIGRALARDCHANTRTIWGQPGLACNSTELDRMNAEVRSCLFH